MCTDYVTYRGDAHGELPRQDHTTGRSEAIRVDKVLKSLPAFRQRAGVLAHALGTHTLLVTLDEPPAKAPLDEAERDPVMSAFLDFLERDMVENPQNLTPFTEADVTRIRELVQGVEVSDDDVLPDEFSF